MVFPKLINNNNNVFEYDGGDLWVRDNVSYWDDQDYCWNNDIQKFIEESNSISQLLWKINYSIPYRNQIEGLKKNQKYKIKKNNKFYCEPIKYSKGELYLVDDILLYDPEIIVNFINKLSGLKKISIAINMISPSDIFMDEDDDWIQQGLNNPEWNTSSFDPSNNDDLQDIKYIKENIDPTITFDFSMDDKGLEILKSNGIL